MARMPVVDLLDILAVLPFPIWNDAMLTNAKIEALQEELIELNTKAQTIQALADKEGRNLSQDEEKELDVISNEFNHIEEDIGRRREVLNQSAKLTQSLGRQTTPEGPEEEEEHPSAPSAMRAQAQEAKPRKQTTRIEMVRADKGKWGWNTVGEFARAVRAASSRGAMGVDPRLEIRDAALGTYGSEGADSDGGFAVPPDFRSAIMSTVMGEDSLLARTDQLTTTSNSITVPMDETTPWQTTGGIQAYWGSEAGTLSQSKIALQERRVGLHKLYALVPVTDELLEDASSLTAYINRKAPEKMAFKINLALVQGNGAGQPLGITQSSALVTASKEVGQLADTVTSKNLFDMYSRMYAPSRPRAVWLVNQDVEPQLFALTMGINNVPVYLPPNGLSQAPFSTIFNRPVIPTQACETVGDLGDIIFADLSQYMSITKTGGVRQDVSIHLWFDQDAIAFRFIMRIGGQPWWSTTVSPRDGSNTLSPFVALEAR